MASPKRKQMRGFVVIKNDWIKESELGGLFESSDPERTTTVLRATDYNLSDYSFIEIDFIPGWLKGRSLKVFVPRSEVAGIFASEDMEAVSKELGFKTGHSSPGLQNHKILSGQ